MGVGVKWAVRVGSGVGVPSCSGGEMQPESNANRKRKETNGNAVALFIKLPYCRNCLKRLHQMVACHHPLLGQRRQYLIFVICIAPGRFELP